MFISHISLSFDSPILPSICNSTRLRYLSRNVNMAHTLKQDSSPSPLPPQPAPLLTPSLDRALRQLKLTEYQFSTPSSKGQSRPFINFAQFDPSAIRGVKPPSDDDTTLMPIGIGIRYWYWSTKELKWVIKESYKWMAVTWTQLLQLHELVVPAERCFFAICLDGRPCSLFFDLDCAVDGDSLPSDVQIAEEMNRLLRDFFSHSLRRDLDVSSIMWTTSTSPVKTSLHGHCRTVSFSDIGAMKQVVLQLREFVSKQITFIKPQWIDDIYTKNRNLRCTFSCKPGKVELRPLYPSDESISEVLWKSMPSYCIQPDSLILVDRATDEKNKPAAKRRRASSPPPPNLMAYFKLSESVRPPTETLVHVDRFSLTIPTASKRVTKTRRTPSPPPPNLMASWKK